MRVDRLERLKEELPKPLPEHVTFDMSWWKTESKCGTSYCAGGLACLIPEFQADGLHLEESYICLGKYWQAGSFDALSIFFELSNSQCYYIFDPKHYGCIDEDDIRPEDVVNHINDVINGRV